MAYTKVSLIINGLTTLEAIQAAGAVSAALGTFIYEQLEVKEPTV